MLSDKNGNQLATVNRYEIPSEKKNDTYVDIDVTLGDNRLNKNVVNHYNALNQLTQTLTRNYKVSFTYDAEGLRTTKTVNGEKTVLVWDGDQLVLELSGSGKVQKRYVRGNDIVYKDKGNNTEKQYYVTDPHGNVVQLTDESGKVTKTYEYDSFGNEVKPDSRDDNPFRYCGEYYDKETEEIYLRARYYQPAVGRFLTRDTYTGESDEPLSLHLYTYCGNDGVNAWDPDGNVWTSIKKKWNSFWNSAKECYNSAKSYVKKFVNNPKKTSVELIRKGVDSWKNSRFGKKFYELTKTGKSKLVNKILDWGGFERDKENNSIFHAKDWCVQKLFGYNDFYDFAFESGTNISKPHKYQFCDENDYRFNMKRQYVIWAWKADYLNLGAGCEVGFYNTYGSTKHYFFVQKLFTELKMKYDKRIINIYKPKKHSWWITIFDAGNQENVNPSKIGVRCIADLTVLKSSVRNKLINRLEISEGRWKIKKRKKATFTWDYN